MKKILLLLLIIGCANQTIRPNPTVYAEEVSFLHLVNSYSFTASERGRFSQNPCDHYDTIYLEYSENKTSENGNYIVKIMLDVPGFCINYDEMELYNSDIYYSNADFYEEYAWNTSSEYIIVQGTYGNYGSYDYNSTRLRMLAESFKEH